MHQLGRPQYHEIRLDAKASDGGKLTYSVEKYPAGMKKFIKISKKGVVTLKRNAKKRNL